jgi:hypothetical protein
MCVKHMLTSQNKHYSQVPQELMTAKPCLPQHAESSSGSACAAVVPAATANLGVGPEYACDAYLHKEAQVCHQGQAAVLDLLDLQLSQGLRVICKTQGVKCTTRVLQQQWGGNEGHTV